ncbi:MAG: phage baseplate protein [Spirochaetota bacterium]
MGLLNLIFGTPGMLYDKKTGKNQVILGPISGEDESYSANVCSHAVENGSEISDHVHAQPGQFSIKTFLVDKNDLMAMAVGLVTGDNQTVSEKLALLKLWRENGELLVYSGPVFSGLILRGYDMYVEDVVITSLGISRTVDNGEGMEVSLSLKKIIIADALTTSVRLPQPVRSATISGQHNTGNISANASKTSFAAKVFGSK